MSRRQTCVSLEDALLCATCGARASFVEECTDPTFAPGEITLIQCPSSSCKSRSWFFCNSCKKRANRNSLTQHAKRKKHLEQHQIAFPPVPAPRPDPPAFENIFGQDAPMACVDEEEVAMMDTDAFCKRMEEELAETHINNATSSLEAVNPTTIETDNVILCNYPKINMDGNEWLARELKGTARATTQELLAAFSRPQLEHMRNFWAAEIASGVGRCGGGLSYLTARAFQQVKDAKLDHGRYPQYQEALWQFFNMIQYQSMSDKQKWRQSQINQTLVEQLPVQPEPVLFGRTHLPPYNHLARYYGNTGQHSIWNGLPCPRARDVEGVAYVSPLDVIVFAMANGVPIDDVCVKADRPVGNDDPASVRTVNHVSECRKAVDWMRSIKTGYFDGAPDLNQDGAPKFETVVCIAVSDWTDGFGPGKVKNNRNSVDLKSFTISPPKHLVNATENTFPVAMGLKKSSKGWKQVERLFREDLESLTKSPKPILLYHGVLQKMVPCFFKRFAVMSDRIERNGLTGTMGCGSDTHRCFSVSGKISTAPCRKKELETYLGREADGRKKNAYGWSKSFVPIDGNNGAVLPSCLSCRKAGLERLGLEFKKGATNEEACSKCSDWELLPQEEQRQGLLDFPAHSDYPASATEGSPIPPPTGRDLFAEELTLPFIQLSWQTMKQACKFAFYQSSLGTTAHWNKGPTLTYLRYCGVSNALAEELYGVARSCAKSKLQHTVNYQDEEGISDFRFPASWLSAEVSLRDYIEAIMHQLFLGVADSNFSLIEIWLKSVPASSKLAVATFKNVLQVLLKDLRPLMLDWLAAYPLTGKKGNLGTGSWVAENWVCFVRISQFIYGWCVSNHADTAKHGVDDMSRMVIAFHAMVSRCCTHGGVNDDFIKETALYMKEFLSSVQEFDVRARYQVLNANRTTTKGTTESWWLKPNYMSLLNLVSMMTVLGPLVEWWDGGGKGERFIQVVKPHIKHGVREDISCFFVNLMNKLYKSKQTELLEKLYGILQGGNNHSDQSAMHVLGDVIALLDAELPEASEGPVDETTREDNESKEDDVDNSVEDDALFSRSEIYGMTKKRTIHVYRNEQRLLEALSQKKPIAGIVEVVEKEGNTEFEFKTVYRKPVKQFARQKIAFADNSGVQYHGMWCAPIQLEAQVECTTSFAEVQSAGRLSAVAIPLWYVLGKDHQDSFKYCVITNWWKYRTREGKYSFPTLDPALYGAGTSTNKSSTTRRHSTSSSSHVVRVENGMEVAEL